MPFSIINPSSSGGASNEIQELAADPVSPSAEEVWILRTGAFIGGGDPIGLLLTLTYPGTGGFTYQLSYKTLEGPIIRVALS